MMARFHHGVESALDPELSAALRELPDHYHVLIGFNVPRTTRVAEALVLRLAGEQSAMFMVSTIRMDAPLRGQAQGPWEILIEEDGERFWEEYIPPLGDTNPLLGLQYTANKCQDWIAANLPALEDPLHPWRVDVHPQVFPRLLILSDHPVEVERHSWVWYFDDSQQLVEHLEAWRPRDPFPLTPAVLRQIIEEFELEPEEPWDDRPVEITAESIKDLQREWVSLGHDISNLRKLLNQATEAVDSIRNRGRQIDDALKHLATGIEMETSPMLSDGYDGADDDDEPVEARKPRRRPATDDDFPDDDIDDVEDIADEEEEVEEQPRPKRRRAAKEEIEEVEASGDDDDDGDDEPPKPKKRRRISTTDEDAGEAPTRTRRRRVSTKADATVDVVTTDEETADAVSSIASDESGAALEIASKDSLESVDAPAAEVVEEQEPEPVKKPTVKKKRVTPKKVEPKPEPEPVTAEESSEDKAPDEPIDYSAYAPTLPSFSGRPQPGKRVVSAGGGMQRSHVGSPMIRQMGSSARSNEPMRLLPAAIRSLPHSPTARTAARIEAAFRRIMPHFALGPFGFSSFEQFLNLAVEDGRIRGGEGTYWLPEENALPPAQGFSGTGAQAISKTAAMVEKAVAVLLELPEEQQRWLIKEFFSIQGRARFLTQRYIARGLTYGRPPVPLTESEADDLVLAAKHLKLLRESESPHDDAPRYTLEVNTDHPFVQAVVSEDKTLPNLDELPSQEARV